MTTVIESFVAELGWRETGSNVVTKHNKETKSLISGLAKLSALYTAAAGFVTGYVAHVNAQTAAQYRLAKSLSVSYEWLDTWADGTKSVGIGAEGMSTALGFLQKQLGNAAINPKGAKDTVDALNAIGISYKEIANKETSKQFDLITSALSNVDGKAVRFAVSAKLFGRNGGAAFAKLAQLAKSEGKTIEEYVGRYADLSFETEKSARGALRFSAALGRTKYAINEAKTAFAGYIGEALAPMIESLNEWVKNNREIIRGKLIEWAKSASNWLKDVWGYITKLGKLIGPLVNAFGGLGNVMGIAAAAFAASKLGPFVKGLDLAKISIGSLSKSIGSVGSSIGLIGAIEGIGIAVESLSHTGEDISDRTDWAAQYAAKINIGLANAKRYIMEFIFGPLTDLEARSMSNKADQNLLKIFDNMQSGLQSFTNWVNTNIPGPLELLNKIKNAVIGFFNIPAYLANQWKNAPTTDEVLDTVKSGASARNASGYLRNGISGTTQYNKPYEDYGPMRPQSVAPKNTSSNYFNGNVNAPITINAAPGMNEKEIGPMVEKHLKKTMKRAVRTLANGE